MTTVQSFEVNYFSENTYIVYDETKEGVIIDCVRICIWIISSETSSSGNNTD